MDIGKKIKNLKSQKGITQETLADLLSVSPQAVSKWETGAAMPDILLLPELAITFGITLDELFDLNTEQRMKRIQNMLWDERELSPDSVKSETAFLLDLALKEPENAECLKLLAEMENHQAKAHPGRQPPAMPGRPSKESRNTRTPMESWWRPKAAKWLTGMSPPTTI